MYLSFTSDVIKLSFYLTVHFRLSADGKYGNVNPNMIGGWDGMVGELVRNVSLLTPIGISIG